MSHATQKRRYQLRRRRERIDLLRAVLIETLGGRCAQHGCETPFDDLEIDHVIGCTWNQRAAGREGRHLRYVREFREGVPLQVLCRSCNAAKNQHGLRRAWARFYEWARAA